MRNAGYDELIVFSIIAGFLEILGQLTGVGSVTKEEFLSKPFLLFKLLNIIFISQSD